MDETSASEIAFAANESLRLTAQSTAALWALVALIVSINLSS